MDQSGRKVSTLQPEQAEALLRQGLAKPVGRRKHPVRCLMLLVPIRRVWAFLRGGRHLPTRPSKTFTVARVGAKRLPVYEHLPRCLAFGGTESLPIVMVPGNGTGNGRVQAPSFEVIPNERGLSEGKEGEGAAKVDLGTPDETESVEAAQSQCSTDDKQDGELSAQQVAAPVRDPYQLLGLAVIKQAVDDGAREWFQSGSMFRFWCALAQLDPGWVQAKAKRVERQTRTVECRGLTQQGRCWYVTIYAGGQRQKIKLGRDLDQPTALRLALEERQKKSNLSSPKMALESPHAGLAVATEGESNGRGTAKRS